MASSQDDVEVEEDPSAANVEEPQQGVLQLKQICKEKWDAVKLNHEEIYKQDSNVEVDESLGLAQILHEKEKRIQSEIDLVKNSQPVILPDNPNILRQVLVKDLHSSISQLREVLTLVRGQEKEIRDQITQEEEAAQQLQSVGGCLEVKLEGIESNDDEDITMPRVMQELDDKIRKAEAMKKTLTKRLVHFVYNHFPLPSADDIKAGKKKLRSSDRKTSIDNLLPFKVVLQELMNKCIDEPHDPYIILTDRFWPPYIELLLRCQIVLRHPDDDQRIKLIPFHL